MRVNGRRVPVQGGGRRTILTKTFPAPIRGLILNENIAAPQPGGATLIENWRPTTTGIALRGGARRFATLDAPIVSFMSYGGYAQAKLFAATATKVFDITAPASPTVVPAATLSARTSGEYSSVNFATAGGSFMIAANGNDPVQKYDGTSFADAAITVATSSNLSQVWVFANRLFFVEKGTFNAWYLPVGLVGGGATAFPLAGTFQNGGSLLFGARWSQDSGSGLDDNCLFVSTTGEVAVYQGSDPATDFKIVGRYEIGRPLGKSAFMQAGGDLLVVTSEGLVPISEAVKKDRAALSLASISRSIPPIWSTDADAYRGAWTIAKWSDRKVAMIAPPASAGQDRKVHVVHLETGAWSVYTGWDGQAIVEHSGLVYFGTSDNKVMLAETGGMDDGQSYVSRVVLQFDHLDNPGPRKTVRMARATFLASEPFGPQVSASTDYAINLPAPPSADTTSSTTDVWDVGLWDVALWSASKTRMVSTRWNSIGRTGFTVGMQIQVTCGSPATPDAELVSIDVTYEVGALT